MVASGARKAAIIGGGVIGGGWAARFALMGWNVRIHDTDRDAERRINAILGRARASMPGLWDVALPDEGKISFHDDLAEAVEGAEWIQESVPERLDLKHEVYAAIQSACTETAIIGSSSSGFRPSELAEGAARPGQIVVAHPFNPVYLIPLVEIVTGPGTGEARIERIRSTLRDIGAHPLFLRREIDAHIADRLLAAVWREALWLVSDGVADTAEIDDAIRYGFGLRWAQMGLFETYRIAGGEAGMRQLLTRLGASPNLPWSKLTDMPELTDELVETIASQSDAQSGRHSTAELEQIRDANLVSILRGLKTRDWGAGRLLNATDRRIDGAPKGLDALSLTGPLPTGARAVPLDWSDINGHMTEHRYLQAFGDATDRFLGLVGCDAEYIACGHSYFTAETHIRHLAEIRAGALIEIDTQLLLAEGRRMQVFHRMWESSRLVATAEHMLVHVDLGSRRAVAPPADLKERLDKVAAAHAHLPRPEGAGAAVGRPLERKAETDAGPEAG
ncbi:carnitine 3-dehydrogenase [Limimaricola hongkongensis]|uniref:3-hydroxyacyl-CoA dehydrogenase n=1 Tax=Limimaricola hongkongensis DSM 17492 TaxID=1122180 RepID=A0A017HAX6_9RHOB|nr:carnitine 3-dehydrogenase [Limimaricola hongkongensis]EYD70939.1 3-hydroxyacyl-CoA dehydrogenase [Limimaricola hongkongensis DSM 17492]